jgi:homogentisate 1,2-dioxygenase
MKLYRHEGLTAERPHLNLPKNTFEEELGLDGFYGPVSHLYHRTAPTQWSSIEKSSFQWPAREENKSDFLKPQCFKNLPQSGGGDFFKSDRLLFWNDDIAIHSLWMTEPMGGYFRNADASELYFIHSGAVSLDSPFGKLEAKSGDYLVIPKGVTYRLKTTGVYMLRVENFSSYFKKPETGILGQQALYHEEGIRTPEFTPDLNEEKNSVVRVQSGYQITKITYDFDIRNLSGWFGTLYPYILPVSKIAPVLSSVAHLPPSINSTFMGTNFIVCTFLPRPLEEPEGALKVPFFHSNIDYDEFIFYHDGDFFSRDNMEKGYITLHPRGINHGPHPKAIANQNAKKRTDEIAVMIDTVKPLKVSKFARELELNDYWKSWKKS